jgi:hypothetical protein
LTDGEDLGTVTTTTNAHANVQVGESLAAEQNDRLKNLGAQNLGLHELQRRTVDLDQTTTWTAMSDSDGGFLM